MKKRVTKSLCFKHKSKIPGLKTGTTDALFVFVKYCNAKNVVIVSE